MRKNYTLKLKLKSLLEERGLTQKKLSELSGVRESTISDIVRGSRTLINCEHFEKLARELEISEITELIDFDE